MAPRRYYVSTSGDDSASGTEDEPLRTINCALGRVAPGDTVLVRGGSYHEFVRPTVSGERGRVITLAACPGETVKIDGTRLEISGWLQALVRVEVDYMTFENLHVCHAVNAAPNSDPEGFYICGSARGITLRGCKVYDIRNTSLQNSSEETSPESVTGSPISCDSTWPFHGFSSVEIIYVSTAGASPVV